MSWISPTFGGDDESLMPPPPKKRNGSAKSKVPETTATETVLSSTNLSSCNWLQTYKPKSIDDLAVNVKKVKELESCLMQSSKLNAPKFMLLTGPSGCGKTCTLETVCKSLGFKVLEWITPLDKPPEDSEYPLNKFEYTKSAVKLFEEYLFRSSRYGSCLTLGTSKKVVLVKDFPNAFLHNTSVFHELLGNFVEKCLNPVVFICSDDALCRKLFPINLKNTCQIQTVVFNPITEQRMFKLLKALVVQETKTNKTIKVLSDGAIRTVSSICQGDIRSAITKLYFCSINSSFDIAQLKRQSIFTRNKASNESACDKDKKIDFFRGVGRVLFPKRIDSPKNLKFVHSTEDIVDHFVSEPNSFINQLHENYPSKLGNINDLCDAAEKMSNSDVLISRWQDKDIFQTYALTVAVKGLMVCNRHPQKGRFEPFRRSTTSRVDVDSKALELEGKAMFPQLNILDYTSMIDILPFARLLIPDLNPAQLDYAQKTSRFKSF